MARPGPLAQFYQDVKISDRTLSMTVQQTGRDVRQQRSHRWNGTRFTQVAGPTAFPT